MATLIGMVGGDFDLAEECAQEAFTAAVHQWEESGIPEYPRAWIISTARHKAIDRIRRKSRFEAELDPHLAEGSLDVATQPEFYSAEIPDDRLRLIFTCCHPALAPEAQIGLTLRTLCGLETDEIARAFLVPSSTMAQRLVRAKNKIRDARIPYAVPETSEMAARLGAVLHVIYLVFNEGYSASSGVSLTRADLCSEAIRLGRLLVELLPDPEAVFAKVRHAGAVFLGPFCPEAVGDYVAGPNHVLPTGRTARFASGLSVFDFLKRTTFVSATEAALKRVGPAAVALAEAEGLQAHARSIALRLSSQG